MNAPAPSERIAWERMGSREKEAAVRPLWQAGWSASQIARELRATSRSAVIGCVHRMQKAGRLPPARDRGPVTKAPSRSPKAAPRKPSKTLAVLPGGKATTNQFDFKQRAADRASATGLAPHLVTGEARRPIAVAVPQSRRLTLLQLTEQTCKWPNGDPLTEDFSFCGNASGEAGPYCPYHSQISYQPAEMRRRAR